VLCSRIQLDGSLFLAAERRHIAQGQPTVVALAPGAEHSAQGVSQLLVLRMMTVVLKIQKPYALNQKQSQPHGGVP